MTSGSSSGGPYASGVDLDGSPYVVFGPDRSAVTALRTAAALGLATLPIVVRSVESYLLFQTATFAASLAAVLLVVRRWSPEPSPERVGALLAGLGLLGVVGPVVGQGFRLAPVSGPAVFALALGLLAWDGRLGDRMRTARPQALVAAGLLVVAFLTLVPVYVLGTRFERPLLVAARSVGLAVPLAVMLPLGAVLDERPRAARWWVLTVIGFVVLILSMVNPADPPTGLAGGLTTFFLLGLALFGPLLGAPVVVLGRRLADASPGRDTDGSRAAADGPVTPSE